MAVLSFDPGNITGWCYSDKGLPVKYGIIKYKKNQFDYMAQVSGLYKFFLPEIVMIEEPFSNPQKPNVVSSLARCVERITIAVKLQFRDACIYEIPPAQWKKEFVGKGNAGKQDVLEHVETKFRLGLTELYGKKADNISDAIAIALVGEQMYERSKSGNDKK